MSQSRQYPRDLIGYGKHPPHADWPENARIAVQFVLNYEEGGESNILHGDPGSEQFLSEIPVVPPPRREDAQTLLDAVLRLTQGPPPGEQAVLEDRLARKVSALLSPRR